MTTIVGDREVTTSGSVSLGPGRRASSRETEYELRVDGAEATELLPGRVATLPRPAGARLATFATVNDVHFGEVECGRLGTPEELGPILRAEPGAEPYPT